MNEKKTKNVLNGTEKNQETDGYETDKLKRKEITITETRKRN